ncbi:MAG: spore photoproduct lyase [Gammaproteobacteria bacterium]|jgi:spore photoproduct lyase
MIDTIYVERQVFDHVRVKSILQRYPRARVIECATYQEIFNRKGQNFRAQKSRPALILAHKASPYLHTVPREQHIGAVHNYYFSHLLNCPFDCRYCFLQGMFTSANYVLFVNYEDFATEIYETCARHEGPVHIFSGYDCDSLALEPLTGFADYFIDSLANLDNVVLELRTKSTQIRSLLAKQPSPRCVVAMSLAPESIGKSLEHGTPSLKDRLTALRRLQNHGWPVGLRFDPLIPIAGYVEVYEAFFAQVFSEIDAHTVHSVTVGALRLPRSFAKRLVRLYPDEPLFAAATEDHDGTLLFVEHDNPGLLTGARSALEAYVPLDRIFDQHASP